MSFAHKKNCSNCSASNDSPLRTITRITALLMAVMILALTGSAMAQTVTVWTDKSDYPPGDSVVIYGNGYMSGESVEVQVLHYNSIVPDTGDGHDPWSIVADGSGDFETYWIIPYDDHLDETLEVTATGLTSGWVATTIFADASTILYLSDLLPDSICSTYDSVDVCAILEEQCGGSGYAPLEGRELIFFFSNTNCGVDIAQTGEDTVLTDANGEACGRLQIPPTPGDYRIRVKYLGESKPGPGDPPNGACNPNARVQLSNANVCEPMIVDPAACCDLIITCPADIAIACDASIDPSNTGTATVTCDGIITYSDATTAGACANSYTITRTWIATEGNNADTCYQTITVIDTLAPVLAGCPADVTVQCDAIPAAATPTATDNCDVSPVITFVETEVAGACANAKTITRVWTATDACGNSSSCTQVIIVEDTTAPVLAGCPADVTVQCNAIPAAATPTATDNCDVSPVITFVETEVAGACANAKTITRTWTATDACGNSSSCSQTIIVEDTTDPVLAGCPADVTVQCDAIPSPPNVTATDNCAGVTLDFSETEIPGACGDAKTITRTWTATDACGNSSSCTQTITVEDTTAPVLVDCPADVTAECGAIPTSTPPTATDNCDVSPVITFAETETAGACANAKTITRTWTATDACGNSSSCSQTINVVDTTAPVCTVPSDATLFQCEPTQVCLPVSSTDNCDLNPTIAVLSGPGTIVNGEWCYTPTGSETASVTIESTDACGNSCESSFIITFEVNSAPVCVVPGSATVSMCAPTEYAIGVSCTDIDGNLSAGYPMIVSGPGAIVGGQWVYTPTESGPVTVTIRCQDDCGAFCESTFTKTFELNEAPVCIVPDDQTIFQCEPTEVCLPVGCTDVDGNLITNTPTIVSGPGTIINGEWCYTPAGAETVNVTVKCQDDCGAMSECSFAITFEMNQSVQCSVPDDQTIFQCVPEQICLPVGCTDGDGNVLPNQPTIVSGPGVITNGEWCYTPAGDETAIVTIQCEDECGSTSQCTFIIEFDINEAPVCQVPADQTLFQCEPTLISLPVGCTDVDGNENVPTIISGPGSIVNGNWEYLPAGDESFTVVIGCSDLCGATSECSFNVTVDINEAPVCEVPVDQLFNQCVAEQICLPIGCTDADGNQLSSVPTIVSGPGFILGNAWCYEPAGSEVATVTLQCEDECGAICQSTFEITFVVNSAPVCTVPEDQSFFQCTPTQVCLPVGCTDVDGNLLASQPTIISGPGTIVNGEWCYTPTGDETATVVVQCEDECGAICQSIFIITFDVNENPVCTVPEDATYEQCEPTEVCLPVGCTDADGNQLASSPIVKFGPGTIVDGEWCYTPAGDETAVVTIECEDECGAISQCTFSIEFIVNSAPVIVDCPDDTTVGWYGGFISRTITASDADGIETVTFSLGAGSPGSINASGVFTWTTNGNSVCGGDITIIVTDDCDLADTCVFNVCVTNEPPVIACSDPAQVCWGSTLTGQVTATDADPGPMDIFYSVVSFDGPGTVTINGATGEYSWVTEQTNDYAGTFELCIEATDNANICPPCSPSNADTCWISLTVVPAYQVIIEKTHGTLQGHYVNVAVYLDSSITYTDMGGFDFLIAYDASALTFSGATQGQLLTDCGWEYFTYRFGANGNCDGGCPSGEIRLVGIAETNNGDNHPLCRTNDGVSSILANLTFLVSNDRTLECNYIPIRFHWYECADNTISSPGGDTLYLASNVYDYRPLDGQGNYQDITNTTASFPSFTGAHYTCDEGDKFEPLRCLEFYNGGVDIICADSIDARGDINLDGLAYTISDAVMFINYFIHGLNAFTDITEVNSYGFAAGYEGSVAASDVNADGLALTVSDMVYLIRVIVGDAVPYPKVSPLAVDMNIENGILSVDHDMGAAYLLVKGLETPTLLANNVDMKFSHEDGNTKIIIYSISSESFRDDFLAVDGEILTLEMATYEGQPALTKLMPSEFKLDQNYPNPFNPTTMIRFQIPTGSKVKLEIYNVQGQIVATLVDQYLEAGTHQFPWVSSGSSSGIYFYRLETNMISETRKMILLK